MVTRHVVTLNISLSSPCMYIQNFRPQTKLFFSSSLLAQRIAIKAYKKQKRFVLFLHIHKFMYIHTIALGESPRTHVSPPQKNLLPPTCSTELFFLFFPFSERKDERGGKMGDGRRRRERGRERAETRRHKSNLRGLYIPLSLFSIQLFGGGAR